MKIKIESLRTFLLFALSSILRMQQTSTVTQKNKQKKQFAGQFFAFAPPFWCNGVHYSSVHVSYWALLKGVEKKTWTF